MGFLDFILGKTSSTNCKIASDKIWLSEDAKFAGIAREVAQRSTSGTAAILLVAHFQDVRDCLDEVIQETLTTPVKTFLASDLSADVASDLTLDESAIIDIIVAERHPLPTVDDNLRQFAESISSHCRLGHHLSLEDPILRIFVGDSTQQVLENLGMAEDKPIESRMVSKRIRGAQLKIQSTTIGNGEADSAEDWFQNYCPRGRRMLEE